MRLGFTGEHRVEPRVDGRRVAETQPLGHKVTHSVERINHKQREPRCRARKAPHVAGVAFSAHEPEREGCPPPLGNRCEHCLKRLKLLPRMRFLGEKDDRQRDPKALEVKVIARRDLSKRCVLAAQQEQLERLDRGEVAFENPRLGRIALVILVEHNPLRLRLRLKRLHSECKLVAKPRRHMRKGLGSIAAMRIVDRGPKRNRRAGEAPHDSALEASHKKLAIGLRVKEHNGWRGSPRQKEPHARRREVIELVAGHIPDSAHLSAAMVDMHCRDIINIERARELGVGHDVNPRKAHRVVLGRHSLENSERGLAVRRACSAEENGSKVVALDKRVKAACA
eukprot:Amastigsp_a2841_27.p2 type:complete len:339 gc:universal Amastigsp_a2841_27:704-1720(+)